MSEVRREVVSDKGRLNEERSVIESISILHRKYFVSYKDLHEEMDFTQRGRTTGMVSVYHQRKRKAKMAYLKYADILTGCNEAF